MRSRWFTIVGAVVALFVSGAQAQVDAEPLPGDPKLVTFSYDPNNSYRVFTRPLASTHIELEKDERVKFLALGDTAGWITAYKGDNNIFIKPRFPNVNTPGTLVTTKRTYQFVFRSTTENGRWYQRVSFSNPEDIAIEAMAVDRARLQSVDGGVVERSDRSELRNQRLTLSAPAEKLNFNYELVGDASFRPVAVFDDGESTFVQLRSGQDVPALFRLMSEKDIELVDYVLKANTLQVPRVLEAGLLKLGAQEVRFYNRHKVKKSLFGGNEINDGARP